MICFGLFKGLCGLFVILNSMLLINCLRKVELSLNDNDIGISQTLNSNNQAKQNQVNIQQVDFLKELLKKRLTSTKTYDVALKENFEGTYHKRDIEEIYSVNDDFVSYLGFLGDSAKLKKMK